MWKPVEIPVNADDLQAASVKIVAVEAGHLAAYALDADGKLYAWGTHLFGQLGYEEEPEPVVEETEAGSGSEDLTTEQLEDGDDTEEEDEELPLAKLVVVEKVPRVVEALTGHALVKVSAGNHFVVAMSSTGEVFSWGRGCFGQLGSGNTGNVTVPRRIPALEAFVALDVAAGTGHVLGVFVAREQSQHPHQTENTVVLAWGRGRDGCLGLGGASNESLPVENTFFRGLGAVKVAAGGDHSLVLCRASTQTFLYAFGGNRLGQLGVASPADHIDMPTLVDEFLNVRVAAIGAGAQYSAALTGDGELFTWGDARYGKTCRSDRRTTFVPWKVELPNSLSPSFTTQLSVGTHHSLAQLRLRTFLLA
ncbi:hypothetical protein BBJ28_00002838 [Nothophytophthora sp. Chile5]|nr:hypothetical protein BBJ28_00002838 [Nothophytophthora sp. Chile5]